MDTHAATALALTRIIPAPPEAVFAALIEPEKVKAWIGPCGMTCPTAEIEPREGGRHVTVLRDAAGTDHPNPMRIVAIAPGRRLVLRVPEEEAGSCPLPGAVGTFDVLPHEQGTRLDLRWDHPRPAMRERHEAMGFHQGWQQTLDKLSAVASAPAVTCGPALPPTPEHGWLHRLLGDWVYEHDCTMPDGSVETSRGTEKVRALGPWWVIGEGEGTMPGGGTMRWTVTMGFDGATRRFRGSWIGSMMGWMFLYDGALSEDGRSLPLLSEGPAFDGRGMATYRDTTTLEDDGTRRLTSEVKGPDGDWVRFMSGVFRRIG